MKPLMNREEIAALRRMILARINIEFNVMMQLPAEETEAIDQRIQTWNFPLQPIPVECLYDSFIYAMQCRDHTFKLAPPELLIAYKQLLNGAQIQADVANDFDPRRALTENAAAGCERCFGTNREIVQSASGYTEARTCDHAPLSEDEKRARDEAKQKFDQAVRALRRRNFDFVKPKTEENAPPPIVICPECNQEAQESKTIKALRNCRDSFETDKSGAINRCPGRLFFKDSIKMLGETKNEK
jgi:hypothetical protein